ncbi:MAG: hypothetical protein ACK58L_08085 [Planctomycetota bacterium]
MKQILFKVLTVFITVVAVCLMGAALAMFFVHPDPRSEMNTDAMKNYTFTFEGGENPKWTVTRRFSTNPADAKERGNVGTFPNAYAALTKAHRDWKDFLTSQTQPFVESKAKMDEEATQFSASQLMDTQAIQQRLTFLNEVSDQKTKILQKRATELGELSEKSRQVRDETEARRTDVVRLQHELEEVRTDIFRLTEIRRDLTDRLIRLEIENSELEARQQQVSAKASSK